jgi:hypothetical protein
MIFCLIKQKTDHKTGLFPIKISPQPLKRVGSGIKDESLKSEKGSIMKALVLLGTFLLGQSLAYAYKGEYRLGLYKGASLDVNQTTHIIVVGSGVKDDSNGFFQSGVARAQKYKELYPNDQVVIMSSPEVKGADDDEVFQEFNIPVVKLIKESFTAEILLSELKNYPRIASLDFYGHSSPWALKLGKSDAAFVPSIYEKKLRALKANFLRTAVITLNGCNSGFSIAPDLSKYLEIPVSGSLTSTVLERLESDGKWYKEANWHSESGVTVNDVSFDDRLECYLGLCTRMKPTYASYASYWGYFKEGGLSFYKFFCNYENNTDGRCEAGMASSLLSFPSVKSINKDSSAEDFKAVAFDYLCSTHTNRAKYDDCVKGITAAIERGDLVYQSHPTAELNCSFKSCNAKVACKEKRFGSGPKGGSCKLETTIRPNPTNAAQEMISFMKGFDLIKNK